MSYGRHMRRTLLRQRIAEILNPGELTLVRNYLGLCHPEEKGITFQEMTVRLNYNGPSGVEKAYKNAINKLKKHLHGGAYARWLDVQQAIREAQCGAKADSERVQLSSSASCPVSAHPFSSDIQTP